MTFILCMYLFFKRVSTRAGPNNNNHHSIQAPLVAYYLLNALVSAADGWFARPNNNDQGAEEKDTHPADGHHVVAHQNSSHKLGLDALSQQDLLEVRQARLVDEHRLMPSDLEGEQRSQTLSCFFCELLSQDQVTVAGAL